MRTSNIEYLSVPASGETEGQDEFRTLFERAGVGMARTDIASGRFVRVNCKLCKLIGYSRDELVQMTYLELTHPEDRERDEDIARQILEGELEQWQTEQRYLCRDGSILWVQVTGTVLRDGASQPVQAIAVIQDITERKRAQEELVEGHRRKDEFLAVLAHELRNPLSALHSALALLRLPALPDSQRTWAEAVMSRQVKQLGRLIDDLLDVSRITRGKIQLKKECVELNEIVQRAIETVMPLLDASEHELVVSSAGGPLWVDGDPTRLEQAVVNLLTNAVKYTKTRGSIWLSLQRHGAHAGIRVKDSGIGIPSDKLPDIFELFTQVHHARDASPGGLGIGLTLVRTLIEMHGGKVLASSDGAGHGSEFEIRLPVAGEHEDPVAVEPTLSAVPEVCKRVLVVDDNRDGAMTLSMLLELEGHQTELAYDGRSALAVAQQFEPDVVLLDIGLPGMDGYEVARALRRTHGLQEARLIAISGYGQADDRRRAREAGFDAHLLKPVDRDRLLALLAQTGKGSA